MSAIPVATPAASIRTMGADGPVLVDPDTSEVVGVVIAATDGCALSESDLDRHFDAGRWLTPVHFDFGDGPLVSAYACHVQRRRGDSRGAVTHSGRSQSATVRPVGDLAAGTAPRRVRHIADELHSRRPPVDRLAVLTRCRIAAEAAVPASRARAQGRLFTDTGRQARYAAADAVFRSVAS